MGSVEEQSVRDQHVECQFPELVQRILHFSISIRHQSSSSCIDAGRAVISIFKTIDFRWGQ